MTPQRPALAEVLAALTEREEANDHALIVRWWQRDEGASGMATARVVISDRGARFAYETNDRRPMTVLGPLSRWAHASPAEAVESLATARLWPWEPGDDPTRWWCERCGCVGAVTARGGRGGQVIQGVRCDCAGRETTQEECDRTGEEYVSDLRTPPTLPALVAIASLGVGTLRRSVELAGEIARRVRAGGAVVAWRAMSRDAIEDVYLPPEMSVEVARGAKRDLQDLGVYLVGLSDSRALLAVEAL